MCIRDRDMGEAPKRFFGDDEYEYWLVVQASDKDRVLLALIQKLYGGDMQALSKFRDDIAEHGIAYDFWSYV